MTRKEELISIFKDANEDVCTIVTPLIDQMVFLEEQIAILEGTPHIKINPKDPSMQKMLPAGKLHKEYVAQYKDIVRILCGQLNKATGVEVEDSPLRSYLKTLGND